MFEKRTRYFIKEFGLPSLSFDDEQLAQKTYKRMMSKAKDKSAIKITKRSYLIKLN